MKYPYIFVGKQPHFPQNTLLFIFGNYILDGTDQGFCIFFIWACRRGGGNHVLFAHAIQCRRAVGLSIPMILA
jgi:hypothetical protein